MKPLAWAAVLVTTACGPLALGGPGCEPVGEPVPFPADLEESSGAALSRTHRGVLWTHNDAGSILFAVGEDGEEIARFGLPHPLIDWEDLALAPCPGTGVDCLYAFDVGDNYEEHGHRAVVRFREPDPAADALSPIEIFRFVFPDGPRDVEAALVLPGERILLVTKGRNHSQTVYRYPGPLRPDTVTLEPVQELSDGPRIFPRQITGGAVAPDGSLVALRTYQSIEFYRVVSDTLVALEGGLVNLRTLQEPQGEGVAIGPNGRVVLTTEGGPGGGPGGMSVLRCRIDGLA